MTLKELREEMGYSQLAVESITGVPQSTLSRLERKVITKSRDALLEHAIMQALIEYEKGRKKQN